MEKTENNFLTIIGGIGIYLILYMVVGSVLAESFGISSGGIAKGLIIIGIILAISYFFRRSRGQVSERVFIITNFIISLLLSILILTPIIGLIALWKTYNDADVRRNSIYILIIHVLISTIYTIVKLKKYRDEKFKKEEGFRREAINKTTNSLEKEIIKRVPPFALLDDYIEIFKKLYQYDIEEESTNWYTNSDFINKSKELLNILDTLKDIKIKEAMIIEQVFNNSFKLSEIEGIFSFRNSRSPISQCYALLKGHRGEEKTKEILDSLNLFYYEGFNLRDDLQAESVEIDFITAIDGIIYTIEVKDYLADTIVLESSGQFIRKSGKHTYHLDTLRQISRHNKFLRRTMGSDINIKNIIALTDRRTLVQDNFKNENIKVVYIDALPFFMGKNQSQEDKNILLGMNKYKGEEKKFKFFNIDKVLMQLQGLMEEEKVNKELLTDNLLSKKNLHRLNSDIRCLILEELKQMDGYVKNLKQIDVIIEGVSEQALTNYVNLLNASKGYDS